MFEQLNGSIRYDPDSLAGLRFNPLLSETYKKFSLYSDHDSDANFFSELADYEYYIEEKFNAMLQQKNILGPNNCLSLLHLKVIPHNCIAHPFCAYFMASFSAPSFTRTLKTWQICLDIELCQLKNGYSSPTSTGTPPFSQVIVINLS